MGKAELTTASERIKVRLLRITVDGCRREELAGERTALELQHELRGAGKSVRVTERYVWR